MSETKLDVEKEDLYDELPPPPPRDAPFIYWKSYMELLKAIMKSWTIPPEILDPPEKGDDQSC